MSRPERWSLHADGRQHRVTVADRGLGRTVEWSVGDDVVGERWTMDERMVLAADGYGAIGLHFTTLGRTRRVSWFDAESEAAARAANQIPLSGRDFEPESGSAAARRFDWMRRHPRLYTARSALIAAASTIAGIIAVSLAARWVARIPWPEWTMPTIPLPDWDLPRLPWPEWTLPEFDLPALPPWLAAIASAMTYVVPVIIAAGIAYAETRRRRPMAPQEHPAEPSPGGGADSTDTRSTPTDVTRQPRSPADSLEGGDETG